jgi:hypothetical protein
MIFNQHSDLIGKHAFLSASKYHWINYDEEKIVEAYDKAMTAARGTRLHALAHDLISLGVKLPNTQQTLNMYVNDCIGYRMKTEQVLFYSYDAFGTADAIDFRDRVLKIFDLKNGVTPTKETQLEVYAAFFCLEYKVRPAEIEYDLRIYQNDEIYAFDTDPDRILHIIDRIVQFDQLIKSMKEV